VGSTGLNVAIVFGTRPEAIKIAPVYKELLRRGVGVCTVNTGQHDELMRPMLDLFEIREDHALNVMKAGQPLAALTARLCERLDEVFGAEPPDAVLVQGDTSSAFVGALTAFYHKIPVGHIEAGLRTDNKYSPFPEEINRRCISQVADWHFAPTDWAVANLRREGVPEGQIYRTGNTVVDAVQWLDREHGARMDAHLASMGLEPGSYLLMTMHRRENQGEPMRRVFETVRSYLDEHPGLQLVFPVHRSPAVRDLARTCLGERPNIRLLDAVGYFEFTALMKHSALILTDSGGIQEEAPCFGKMTLVLRDTTERPEAVEAGTSILLGTDPAALREALARHLQADGTPAAALRENPFGDGHAAERVVDVLEPKSLL